MGYDVIVKSLHAICHFLDLLQGYILVFISFLYMIYSLRNADFSLHVEKYDRMT